MDVLRLSTLECYQSGLYCRKHKPILCRPCYYSSLSRITDDCVKYGECLNGGDSRSAGSDSLCWIEFEVLWPATGPIETELSIDNPKTFVMNYTEIMPCTKYDCRVEWGSHAYEHTP